MSVSKVLILVFGILLVWILGFFMLIKYMENGLKDAGLHYSRNERESRQNGLFIGNYVTLDDTACLLGESSELDRIWIEQEWTTKTGFLSSEIIKSPGLTVVAPFLHLAKRNYTIQVAILDNSIDKQQMAFYDPSTGFIGHINHLQDTIKIHIDGGTLHTSRIYVKEK